MEMREEERREGGKGQERAREKVCVVLWRRDLTCWRVRRRVIASGVDGRSVLSVVGGTGFSPSSCSVS